MVRIIMSNSIKPVADDWLPARIKYELELKGWSLRKLSLANGYSDWAMTQTLRRHWPACEKIIAEVIGVKPDEIWPSRYVDGEPIHPVRTHRRGPHRSKPDAGETGKPA